MSDTEQEPTMLESKHGIKPGDRPQDKLVDMMDALDAGQKYATPTYARSAIELAFDMWSESNATIEHLQAENEMKDQFIDALRKHFVVGDLQFAEILEEHEHNQRCYDAWGS